MSEISESSSGALTASPLGAIPLPPPCERGRGWAVFARGALTGLENGRRALPADGSAAPISAGSDFCALLCGLERDAIGNCCSNLLLSVEELGWSGWSVPLPPPPTRNSPAGAREAVAPRKRLSAAGRTSGGAGAPRTAHARYLLFPVVASRGPADEREPDEEPDSSQFASFFWRARNDRRRVPRHAFGHKSSAFEAEYKQEVLIYTSISQNAGKSILNLK